MKKIFVIFIFILGASTYAMGYDVMGKESRPEKRMVYGFFPGLVAVKDGSSGTIKRDDGDQQKCPPQGKTCGADLNPADPAKKGANIAQKAAEEAKAAADAQAAAGAEASQKAKAILADRALQAANSAEAALAGKQQVLSQLESELKEAQIIVEEEKTSYQSTQDNLAILLQGAEEAAAQLQLLLRALADAEKNLALQQQAQQQAIADMNEKAGNANVAQKRLEDLLAKLAAARKDFNKTKHNAYLAVCAAAEAKQRANRTRRSTITNN